MGLGGDGLGPGARAWPAGERPGRGCTGLETSCAPRVDIRVVFFMLVDLMSTSGEAIGGFCALPATRKLSIASLTLPCTTSRASRACGVDTLQAALTISSRSGVEGLAGIDMGVVEVVARSREGVGVAVLRPLGECFRMLACACERVVVRSAAWHACASVISFFESRLSREECVASTPGCDVEV